MQKTGGYSGAAILYAFYESVWETCSDRLAISSSKVPQAIYPDLDGDSLYCRTIQTSMTGFRAGSSVYSEMIAT